MSENRNSSENKKEDGKDSSNENNVSNITSILSRLIDNLTGKDMKISYLFDNLEIEIPRAKGPEGRDLGSVKWRINGTIAITTELHDNTNTNFSKSTLPPIDTNDELSKSIS